MGYEKIIRDSLYLGPASGSRHIRSENDDFILKYGKTASTGKRLDHKVHGTGASEYLEVDSSKDKVALVGKMHLEHADVVLFFDDFLGDVIEDGWNSAADTGGTAAIAAKKGGTLTLTTDATDDDTINVAHELNWFASQGLIFEARVKLDVVTTVGVFIGLSDAKTEASPTLAMTLSGTTFTTTATDAVGFVFDTDATTDVLFAIGVKTDVDTASIQHSAGLVAATYITLRIEVDNTGSAEFFINGTSIGTKANAVATAIGLTPVIQLANRGAFAHVLDVDYVKVIGKSRT